MCCYIIVLRKITEFNIISICKINVKQSKLYTDWWLLGNFRNVLTLMTFFSKTFFEMGTSAVDLAALQLELLSSGGMKGLSWTGAELERLANPESFATELTSEMEIGGAGSWMIRGRNDRHNGRFNGRLVQWKRKTSRVISGSINIFNGTKGLVLLNLFWRNSFLRCFTPRKPQ